MVDPIDPRADSLQEFVRRPRYRTLKTPPVEGSQDIKISKSLNPKRSFEFAAIPFNPAQSYVGFKVTVPEEAADRYTWTRRDFCALIGAVKLVSYAGNVTLWQCDDLPKYLRVAAPLGTKLTDGVTRGPPRSGVDADAEIDGTAAVTAADDPLFDYMEFTVPIGRNMTASSALEGKFPYYNQQRRADGSKYTSPMQLCEVYRERKVNNPADGKAAMTYNMSFHLGCLKDSILGFDEDFYANGHRLKLELQFGYTKAWRWHSNSPLDPTSDAKTSDLESTVSNIYLYTKQEVDPLLETQTRNKFLQRPKINIPWLIQNQMPVSGATQSVVYPLDSTHGTHLRKWWLSPFNVTQEGATVCDNSNKIVTGSATTAFDSPTLTDKIKDYQTTFDNQPQEDFRVSCTKYDAEDWEQNRQYCEGSMITGQDDYRSNWFVMKNYDTPQGFDPQGKNIIGGISLGATPHSIGFNATTDNADAIAGQLFVTNIITNRQLDMSANMTLS